jgi:putative hydrolase of the HAD superfamily
VFSNPGPIPAGAKPRAVLLDALGTLLSLEPPAPRLRAGLWSSLGIEVGDDAASRVVRAEIAYYRDHLHEAPDAGGLADLRWRCATLVRDGLGLDVPVDAVLPVLLDALVFEPFEDVRPALRSLRAAGVALVVVSNWDVSLHEVLVRTGLRPLVDGAVSSAEAGSAKPDGAIFERALALAGTAAAETWHVGDSVEADVHGARRAGIVPVLIDRGARAGRDAGAAGGWTGVRRIASLAELLP